MQRNSLAVAGENDCFDAVASEGCDGFRCALLGRIEEAYESQQNHVRLVSHTKGVDVVHIVLLSYRQDSESTAVVLLIDGVCLLPSFVGELHDLITQIDE